MSGEAGSWTALVWNLGMGSPPRRDPTRTWRRFVELMQECSVDVALLNEVTTDFLVGVSGALYEVWGTRGSPHLDCGPTAYRCRSEAILAVGVGFEPTRELPP